MSGVQSWNLKDIDPKVREAAREAAARQGMSLGEYLNLALQDQQPSRHAPASPASAQTPRPAKPRGPQLAHAADDDDWRVTEPAQSPRVGDPARIAQRMDSIERRTQLALSGLDRAVTMIDRSMFGLATRIEDAEAASGENAQRIADALAHFRAAGDTLGGRMARVESEAGESRRSLDAAQERLETQAAAADEIARRAEAAANFLAAELESRDAAIGLKLGAIEDRQQAAMTRTLSDARIAAEEAARQAVEASSDAMTELRRLREHMTDRLAESELSTRRALESAIAQTHADQQSVRETTAGLRQAAGAAIADLRNAQLGLAARVKQVEETAGRAGELELAALRQRQSDIAERLAGLEHDARQSPMDGALAAFEQRLEDISARVESGAANDKLEQVGGAVKTLDDALRRLTQRLAETETSANHAIRALEETVSGLGARIEHGAAAAETEALRALLEQRLEQMAQSVSQMVGQARNELAGQVQAGLDGLQNQGLENALADVNLRLAVAERRQALTIEAISIEIKRMSETVDRRLRTVEARNDDAAAATVREELARMAATLATRFDEIERREAAAFDRMGLEVGRLSERLEERAGAVEGRSAQAIEQVGEQVARMAERFNQRHDLLARDLGERMIDSEERAGARVSEAIGALMQRLSEVEQHSAEAIAPVRKAVSSVASRLDAFAIDQDDEGPRPSLRFADHDSFDEPAQPYVSPIDAAQPTRAGPIPPKAFAAGPAPTDEDDLFVTDDLDLIVDEFVEEAAFEAEAQHGRPHDFHALETDDILAEDVFTQTPEDADAFWSPDPPTEVEPPLLILADPEPETLAPLQEPEPPPPRKNDYLTNARNAAKARDAASASAPRLRGPSRIALWGATGATAALIAGSAWYLNLRQDADRAQELQQLAPAQALAEEAIGLDPQLAVPTEGSHAEPISEAAATPALSARQNIVAGPLAARVVSLEQAAQSGDLVAQYELALQRLSAGNTTEGMTLLRRAADRGLAMAQYRLAKLYERAEGVEADLAIARQWTERAAAAGNRRAMHDLGVYFARGEGAPLDEAAAFRWFRQAAELGVADSQYNLGVLYQQGRGVGASASEAIFWFLVAARQGDEDAAARASALEPQVQPIQVEQARARAQAFRPRAASAQANGEFGPRQWNAAARPGA